MEFDYRKGGTSRPQPAPAYDLRPSYPSRPAPNPPPPSFYPRVNSSSSGPPPINRPPPPPPSSGPASGVGIKVAIKPEYQLAPLAQLSPLSREVPRSTFQFDFDLERRIIADAEKGNSERTSDIVDHPRQANGGEAVTNMVVDDPMVVEFCASYTLLREMGFPSDAVAGALAMYDNDRERALGHLV